MDKNEKSMPVMQFAAPQESLFSSPYFDITAYSDVSEEFTLADYYPEIRRIISVTAKALPEGKFVSGNTVDCDGVVSFIVTYLGEDSTVAAAPFSVEYSHSIDFPDLPEGAHGNPLVCDTVAESSSCRVTDPRRISLKARLKSRIFADMQQNGDETCVDEAGMPVTGAELLSVERLCEKVRSARCISGAKTDTVSGKLRSGDISRAISADGAINIIDARAQDGTVAVRAEAAVFVLCQRSDGIYETFREKEAFETEVEAAGAKAGDAARAFARAASVTVNSSAEGMSFDIEYDMDVQCMRSETVSLCTDAYSTAFESSPAICEREIYTPLKCSVLHLTASGDIKRKSSAAPGEYLIGVCAAACAEKAEVSDGHLSLSGNVSFQTCVAQNGDVFPEEGKIPFTVTTDIPDTDVQNPVWRADVQAVEQSGRTGNGTVEVSAELVISLFAVDRKKLKTVDRLILDRSKPNKKSGGIHIYFPEKSEEIWNIAKKYSSSRRTLEKLNGWQEGAESAGTSPVIIE